MSTRNEEPTRKSRIRKYKAPEVMEILAAVHGPAEWEPRYNAAEELVYTILSQHTSALNSERANQPLMDTFSTLNAVAEASPEAIEAAIRHGGLAKHKSVRI